MTRDEIGIVCPCCGEYLCFIYDNGDIKLVDNMGKEITTAEECKTSPFCYEFGVKKGGEENGE